MGYPYKLFVTSLFALLVTSLSAQIAVENFYLNESDMTALMAETEVFDMNGQRCALIKVETTQRGFTFDVGTLGVMKVEDKPGELWVYVPLGVKRITIAHQQLGILRDYYFPVQIQGGRTYIMKLISGKVSTVVEYELKKQNLVFNVRTADDTPIEGATLYVNERIWPLTDGSASELMEYGDYSYRVTKPLYETVAGKFRLTKDNHVVEVVLVPKFGFLEIAASSDEVVGAKVFINGEEKGTLPFKSERMESGDYQLTIVHPFYKQFAQSITIGNHQTLQLAPNLSPDFAEVSLKVDDPNIEIWIDGRKQSTGNWSGRLSEGRYVIETQRTNHTKRSRELIVQSGVPIDLSLASPLPIEGQLNITSTPFNATVLLDGERVGTTPLLLSSVLIGEHTIVLQKEGYNDERRTVTIQKNELLEEKFTLNSVFTLTIESNYPGQAELFVDGVSKGLSPVTYEATSGEYLFEGRYQKRVAQQRVKVGPQHNHVFLELKEPPYSYFPKHGIYVQGQASLSAAGLSYGGALGGYWHGINFELLADYYSTELPSIYAYQKSTNRALSFGNHPTYRLGASVGYGIKIGNRLRLTPQASLSTYLGECLVGWFDSSTESYSYDCLYFHPGARLEFGLYKALTLVAHGSYAMKMMVNPAIDQYSHIGLMDFAEGLHLHLGLALSF